MLKRDDWNKDVKEALNQLIQQYQNTNSYVVFDFDNTISIFDSEEMVMNHQLKTMNFAFDLTGLKEILTSGLEQYPIYDQWIEDIVNAFEKKDDIVYLNEFQVKARAMYNVIDQLEGAIKAYPWVCYWFSGMTSQQAYDLSYEALTYYANIPTTLRHYETNLPSKIGKVAYDLIEGISVSENIKELFQELHQAKIDIWICSASHIDVVRAALDVFGLSPYIKGLIAMTCKQENGIYLPQLEEHGYFYLNENGWKKINQKVYSCTQGKGKVQALMDVTYPLYQQGPIAGFGDSTGDYDFLTVFQSMKLGVIFNRLRSDLDGGGILALLASYQNEIKGKDTKYVLQGRNENTRTLMNDAGSILFGHLKSKLYQDTSLLEIWKERKLTTQEIINESAKRFLKEYQQYHTI